jgi:hypothetical protein
VVSDVGPVRGLGVHCVDLDIAVTIASENDDPTSWRQDTESLELGFGALPTENAVRRGDFVNDHKRKRVKPAR